MSTAPCQNHSWLSSSLKRAAKIKTAFQWLDLTIHRADDTLAPTAAGARAGPSRQRRTPASGHGARLARERGTFASGDSQSRRRRSLAVWGHPSPPPSSCRRRPRPVDASSCRRRFLRQLPPPQRVRQRLPPWIRRTVASRRGAMQRYRIYFVSSGWGVPMHRRLRTRGYGGSPSCHRIVAPPPLALCAPPDSAFLTAWSWHWWPSRGPAWWWPARMDVTTERGGGRSPLSHLDPSAAEMPPPGLGHPKTDALRTTRGRGLRGIGWGMEENH